MTLVAVFAQVAPIAFGQPVNVSQAVSAVGDENWDTFGGIFSVNDVVDAVAVVEDGIIVGGRFTEAGGQLVNYMAMWDGVHWRSFGSGLNGAVYALAVIEGEIYAGGAFTEADGQPANHIAKWDGAQWRPLGTGLDGEVYALAVQEDELIVGGRFAYAGEAYARSIARWDGTQWSHMDFGVVTEFGGLGWVKSFLVSEDELIVGGDFARAGGQQVNGIAKWDGIEWAAFGSGTLHRNGGNGDVNAVTTYNGNLVIGGWFVEAGGESAHGLATWDGEQWSSVGDGALYADAPDNVVRDLAVLDDRLIVAGTWEVDFEGRVLKDLVVWDNEGWTSLGLAGTVFDLTLNGSELIASGSLRTVAGRRLFGAATWDGIEWSGVGLDTGSSVNGPVHALTAFQGGVVVGGSFTIADDISVSNIAHWDGVQWSNFSTGVNSSVHALTVLGDELYAGGDFTEAGGTPANHVAKWNGEQWQEMGSGAVLIKPLTSMKVTRAQLERLRDRTEHGAATPDRLSATATHERLDDSED